MNLLSKNKARIRVEIFSKADCHLCDDAKEVLLKAKKKHPLEIIEIDITEDPKMYEAYGQQVPVVFINGRKAFKFRVDEKELQKKINAAQLDRKRK